MSGNYNECPICLSNANSPVVIRCGHIFCKGCIINWINNKGKSECPVCKSGIRFDDIIELFPQDNKNDKGNTDNKWKQNKNDNVKENPTFFDRIAYNFGFHGYRNNPTLRPTNQNEKQRHYLTLSITILLIVIILYYFNKT